jgi:hypothetical protein
MKKIIFGAAVFVTINSFSQTKITDMETLITYKTTEVYINGKPGFVENEAKITSTEITAFMIINNQADLIAAGGNLYTGPREKITSGPFGDEGMSMIICHNTNNFPCMWVREPR